MTQQQAIERWKESAEENLLLMREMMDLKHYDWALFMGQLALEKLLKGLVTHVIDEAPPYTHDLVKLADLANLSLSGERRKQLSQITKFHVQARYDNIKRALYLQATYTFAKQWTGIITEVAVWIKRYF